jgi:hypothetical protein
MKKSEPFLYPLVSLCVPFSRNPLPDWALSYASIVPPMNATLERARTIGMRRDEAREFLMEGSLQRKSKFGLFLDDDVTVPYNIIMSLLYQFSNLPDDVKVIGGIYCSKSSPALPLVFQNVGEGPFYKWKLGEVFECDIIATGMMMIKMDVFGHLTKPWFKDLEGVSDAKEHKLIPDNFGGDYFAINDDGYFCHKVRQAGFKVMAHGGVLGLHWDNNGTAYALPSDSYPVRTEIERRWPGTSETNYKDYINKVFAVYKDYYGCTDLFPVEESIKAELVR